MVAQRTPEQVAHEIQREREQLANAVAHLRTDLREVANVGAMVKAQLPRLAATAGVATAALIVLRAIRRRRRRPTVLANFGRYAVIERD